jgi:hypothetical protein
MRHRDVRRRGVPTARVSRCSRPAWELHNSRRMKNTLTPRLILMFFVSSSCLGGFLGSTFPSVAFGAQGSSKSQLDIEEVGSNGAETRTAAQPADPLGAGIMLGDLNGISVKYLQNYRNSFDGGFSYRSGEYATLHGDYLWNVAELFGLSSVKEKKSSGILAPYFGFGAIMFFDTSKGTTTDSTQLFQRLNSSGIALGARVPLGVEYMPAIVPCGIFGEIAPGTVLIPGMIGFIQAEAGVRFYM